MLTSRVSVVALTSLVLSLPVATAWGDASLDLSYIGSDVIAAVVLHPRSVLTSPDLDVLPTEVFVAVGMEQLGIDPTQIDQAIGIFSLTGLPIGQPGLGAILRFAQPYDENTVLARLGRETEEATHAGKTYRQSRRKDGFALYMPDDRTLLIGTNLQMKSMLAAGQVDTRLTKLLKQADTSKNAVAVLDFAAIRPLATMGLKNLPPLPDDFNEFLELPALVDWIEVSLHIEKGLDLSVTLGAADVKNAGKLKELAEHAKQLARKYAEAQFAETSGRDQDATNKAMAQYLRRMVDKFLNAIVVTAENDRVKIALSPQSPQLATTGVLVALMLPAVQAAREAGRRNQATNQLKQIGLAMHNYADVHKRFPARAILDKDGKPLLSWRVAILPYLDQKALYDQFHLDEPWDSEHNRKLAEQMPPVYSNSNHPSTDSTVYLALDAAQTVFGGSEGKRFRDIIDGTSLTILAVEADPERAVIWTRPDDLKYEAQQPLAGLGHLRTGGFMALFADGHVSFISNAVDPVVMNALVTFAGREPVTLPNP
jgi:prepilin-type processing-associated H-X9-DG protein